MYQKGFAAILIIPIAILAVVTFTIFKSMSKTQVTSIVSPTVKDQNVDEQSSFLDEPPLGTPIRSIVDGVVAAMPTLWSGDISIQITKSGQLERWVYETEHVRNPKVIVGDKVSAGQIIAEVGSFGGGDPPGFGAVEIGILHGGGEGLPEHVCPFVYLDESIKEETFIKMRNLFKSWEEYAGDQNLYDESLPIPGCLTMDPVEG